MSLRARYEETEHHLAGPLGRCISLWSMELRPSSPRKSPWAYDEATQDQLWCEDIDLIDERRWQSAIKNIQYH
jgi:hypothetical protein